MKRVQGIFPNGDYEDIWDKLFLMYDYFEELESEVAKHFNYICDKEETKRVREFLSQRKLNMKEFYASSNYKNAEGKNE